MVKMMVIGLAGAALIALYRDDPEYQEFTEWLIASHWMVKLPGGIGPRFQNRSRKLSCRTSLNGHTKRIIKTIQRPWSG